MATYEQLKVKYYHPCCYKKFSLRHPRYDVSATLRSLSEQPFDFRVHYDGHRDTGNTTRRFKSPKMEALPAGRGKNNQLQK
jgi:hypothetical protein